MVKGLQKIILIFFAGFLFFLPSLSFSQEEEKAKYLRPTVFRSSGTFSTGIFLNGALTASYLTGGFDYYFSEKFSFRSDGFYFLNYLEETGPLLSNHSVFSGVNFHIKTKNNWDPYYFFQPGVAFSQRTVPLCDSLCSLGGQSSSISPLFSGGLGTNYYFQKWFHMFFDVRLTQGTHLSSYQPVSLSDVRFSFGLGWNIICRKDLRLK